MERDPFKEYIKESELDSVNRGYVWSTAIGSGCRWSKAI